VILLADKSLLNYFLQIGRRIFRQRLETGNRESAVEERRVFVFPHLFFQPLLLSVF
jgi:hypothetical protein